MQKAPIVMSAALLTATILAASPPPVQDLIERQALQMGTYSRIQVLGPDRGRGLALAGEALTAIDEAEAILSTWRRESEVSRLNQAPPGLALPLSPDLREWLRAAFAIARDTNHAFDPAVGALTAAWDIHGRGRHPDPAQIEAALASARGRGFVLDGDAGTLRRLLPGAALDTGAFGKGAGLDRAARSLRRAGAAAALLDLGGQLLAVGGPFDVAIAHPLDRERTVARLDLTDASVATSGNGERALDTAQGRIGHILDPRTGRPAADRGSVTVIATTALEADALATALFVLGPDEGLAVARRRTGVSALFLLLERDGSLVARATPDLEARLRDLDLAASPASPDGRQGRP